MAAPGSELRAAVAGASGSAEAGSDQLDVTVLVVSPVRLYREGLALLLSGHAGTRLVGTAGDAAEAAAAAARTRPDVVLLDASLAGIAGVADTMRGGRNDARVIAFGVRDDVTEILACARAGVGGYVGREAAAPDLLAVLAAARRGEQGFSPSLAAALLRRVSEIDGTSPSAAWPVRGVAVGGEAELSGREREIARLVAQGLMNKQIARRLGLSVSTVKNHVHSILRKTGASSRHGIGYPVAASRRAPALTAIQRGI